MRVHVLGPLEVVVDGDVRHLRPAQRRLVATLLLDGAAARSADELIDRLWHDTPPPSARAALHVHLSGIRRAVPGLVEAVAGRYRISPGWWVDRDGFVLGADEAITAAAAGDWTRGHGAARRTLALWRGDPFVDVADAASYAPEVARLGELRLATIEAWAIASIGLGRAAAVVAELRAVLTAHPLREQVAELLMLALHRVGCSSDALRVYQDLRRTMTDLGLEPSEPVRRMEARIIAQDPTLADEMLVRSESNLPIPTTSFVGRRDDVAELCDLVRTQRATVLIGPPGVGKTRLALEVARAMAAEFAGVGFVDLTGATDEVSVVATIARSVGLDEPVENVEQVGTAIQRRGDLVLLDNCDQVIEPLGRLVAELMSSSGSGRVLATSRERLPAVPHASREVAPLDADSAVALLVDRVRSLDRRFVISSAAFDDLLAVCGHAEGLPLALELVASWVPTLGTGDVATLFRTVHGTASVERAYRWGTGLLPAADREILGELSVFVGAFSMSRARTVCERDELTVAGAISRLVGASLLVFERQPGGTARYRMLAPIRDLAARSLTRRRARVIADRHAAAMLDAARSAREAATTEAQATAFATVDQEIADHRAALAHLRRARRWPDVVAHAGALVPYCYGRLLAWEARTWFDGVPIDRVDDSLRSEVFEATAFLAWATHDYEAADRHYRAVLALATAHGDRRQRARALFGLGTIHQKRRFEDGAAMLEEAAAILATIEGAEVDLGECLMFRGLDEAYNGDARQAEALLVRALALLDDAGHLRQVSKTLRWLAHCAWRRGDEPLARDRAQRAEAVARRSGDRLAISGALIESAYVAMTWDDVAGAARHLREALQPVPERDEVDRCQVLLPIARLAYVAGDAALAATIVGYVEDVYERHGWRPPEAAAATRQLITTLGPVPPLTRDAVADATALLDRLADTHDPLPPVDPLAPPDVWSTFAVSHP